MRERMNCVWMDEWWAGGLVFGGLVDGWTGSWMDGWMVDLSIYFFIIPNPLLSIIGVFTCACCVSKKD